MTSRRIHYFGITYQGPMRPGRAVSPINRKLSPYLVGLEMRDGKLWLVCPGRHIPPAVRSILNQERCMINLDYFTE